MRRIGIGLLTLLLVLPAARALDDSKDKKDKPDKKPETPAEEYKALVKEYQDKRQEYVKAYREAKTDAERREVIKEKNPKPDEFAARFLKLAEDNAKDAVGLDAAAWLVQNVGSGAESQKAVKILIANHVENPKIGPVCLPLLYSGSPEAEKFVRAVLEKNPTKEAQGLACYALARYLKNNARGDVNKEWEGLFERAAEKYGDVKYGTRTVADMAKGELFEIRNLAIGKTAPDIEGEDIDGKKFKLSDYRGKVVVLDFWGNW